MKFPGIVTVLCECMSGYREGDCLAWDLVSRSHITLHFGAKVVKKIYLSLSLSIRSDSFRNVEKTLISITKETT